MKRPIRRVSLACLAMVLALLVRANWVQIVDAHALNGNSHNQRNLIEAYSYPRGQILAGGQALTKDLLVNGSFYKYRRGYTNGAMYAPVTGYDSQLYGSNLLEAVENPVLAGTDPRIKATDPLSWLTGATRQGGDVVTTIDPAVQQAAWNGLQGKTGAAVALDPTTGAILALVSTPSYDPGSIAGVDKPFQKAWSSLTKDPAQPMLNRALRQTYPPGSTFKLITAAAALTYGLAPGIDTPTQSPDPYTLPGTTTPLVNEGNIPCRDATLNVALQWSCNTVYGKLGGEVGDARMAAMAHAFGFNTTGQTIPVGVTKSVFDTGINPAQTALSSIGQFDTRATPLQMAMVASAIADNGTLMQPYLVAQERSADATVLTQTQPKRLSQPISSQVAAEIRQMMVNVVNNGTGTTAQIPGLEVGGKTGTAQHGVGNSGNPYAWFVSYAKDSAGHSIATAVVVEASATQRSEISGAGLAAPVAKAMMRAYLHR